MDPTTDPTALLQTAIGNKPFTQVPAPAEHGRPSLHTERMLLSASMTVYLQLDGRQLVHITSTVTGDLWLLEGVHPRRTA